MLRTTIWTALLTACWYIKAAEPASEAAEVLNHTNPFQVGRATTIPKIDGKITDEEWKDTLQLPLNYEVRPGENIEHPYARSS